LRLARKRLGLTQKQIARLLNHRSTKQISRFETGERLPNLRCALKLEKIFELPVGMLFDELDQTVLEEVQQQAKHMYPQRSFGWRTVEAFCAYLEQLKSPNASSDVLDKVRSHAIEIHKKLSDYFQSSRS
jgi:transcriptional regulator with XRE-family HTH domain